MENLLTNVSKNNQIYKKNIIVQVAMLLFFSEMLLFPFPGSANNANSNILKDKQEAFMQKKDLERYQVPVLEIKKNITKIKEVEAEQAIREVKYAKRFVMTAYNSEVGQCDASPCITANGFNVCKHGIEDTVAANFLPFGTEIRIPELFGDKIFVVRDRMNKRHKERVDVWFLSKDNAIDFGVQYPLIEILK